LSLYIGLNVSKKALARANDWKDKNSGESLTEVLLKGDGSLGVSCTLKFQREVGKDSFVDAFSDAFAGCNDVASVTKFKESLGECVGTSVKKGDELVFFWLGSTDIAVAKNGSTPIICNLGSEEICCRLLDVYVDPKRTVSQELRSCVYDHLQKIRTV
jgi:hypothetical protein